MEEYGIAAFRSRQQVMKFEEMLRREGLNVNVISTPRDVALGCGLSVRFAAKDIKAVQNVLSRFNATNLIGIYLIRRTGGQSRLIALSKKS